MLEGILLRPWPIAFVSAQHQAVVGYPVGCVNAALAISQKAWPFQTVLDGNSIEQSFNLALVLQSIRATGGTEQVVHAIDGRAEDKTMLSLTQ